MPSVYRFAASSNATATNVTGLNYAAGGYTFSFWMRWLGGNSGGDIIRQASTANSLRDGYAIVVQAADINVRHYTASAGTTYSAVAGSQHLDQIWKHIAITYDGSTVTGYVNGALRTRTAAPNVPTANAACTTTLVPAINATFVGNLFDLQLILGASVPEQEVPLLMNPTYRHPSLKGRFFGREFVTVPVSTTVRDESGSGNNLATASNTTLQMGEEPPIRPTLA
jgi:hypothetical protein